MAQIDVMTPLLDHAARRLKQSGVDRFELFAHRKRSTTIEVKDKKVDSLTSADDGGVSVRLLKDQRQGFSFTTNLSPAALDLAIDSALQIAGLMPQEEHAELARITSSRAPLMELIDVKGLAVPVAEKIALALRLEAATYAADKRITGIRSASLTESQSEISLMDESGNRLRYDSGMFATSVTCKAENAGDSQMGYDSEFSRVLERLPIEIVAKRAAEYATELLNAQSAQTMRCPAILRNSVVAELLEFISGSFSAEEIAKGRSMLIGKRGERIFAERVHIYDDGTLPGGAASRPFDGEGVFSQRTEIVKSGVFDAPLYDRTYAAKDGTKSTGNASRSVKGPPTISTTNLMLERGSMSFKELLKEAHRGVLITDLMGVHTANPITGDFSLGASGILIENGQLTRPIKGFAVAGNVLECFRKVKEIGSDTRAFGSVITPSLLLPELAISGT